MTEPATEPVKPSPPSSLIFEATTGSIGEVKRGKEISQAEAEARRQRGLDIVVCGSTRCHTISPIHARLKGTHFMKHLIAKPFEPVMKYFTPELYVRFNSPDGAIADQANEDWEAAIAAYQSRTSEIKSLFPSSVRRLSESALHDAELLSLEASSEDTNLGCPSATSRPATAFLAVHHDQQVSSIIYVLSAALQSTSPPNDWPFSKGQVFWLYDEVDVPTAGGFEHRILFSDGRTLTIPFTTAYMHSVEIPVTHSNYRQTA